MRVPKDVFAMIVSYLPVAKVFELWCTGRELHEMKYFRNIYNQMILPHLHMFQNIKFVKYCYENKIFNVNFKDNWLLETFGVMKLYTKFDDSQHNIKKDYIFDVYKNELIFSVLLRSLTVDPTIVIIWKKDDLHNHYFFRMDEFTILKIEYKSNLVVFHLKKYQFPSQ